jgi:hypothetical protein
MGRGVMFKKGKVSDRIRDATSDHNDFGFPRFR